MRRNKKIKNKINCNFSSNCINDHMIKMLICITIQFNIPPTSLNSRLRFLPVENDIYFIIKYFRQLDIQSSELFYLYFTHLKLCHAPAIPGFKWVRINPIYKIMS